MKMRLISKRLTIILIFFGFSTQANAEILFNGDWANYIGPFYGANGWKNGTPTGQPIGDSNWNDFSGYFTPKRIPNTWLGSTSFAADRIQLVQDPSSPKKGIVARFEVRSGDHRLDHWSGERSEMMGMLDADGNKLPVTETSGHEFYAVSVKVSDDWQGPQPESAEKGHAKWGSFMQLHSPNVYNSPPAIKLEANDEFAVEMTSGELITLVSDKKTGLIKQQRQNGEHFALANGDLRRGHWVQFLLDVTWKTDATGAVKLYRRDEGESDFHTVLQLTGIPTLQTSQYIPTDLAHCPSCAPDNIVHYWRVGYYRSTSPNQTNVLWLGPVVRGTTFDEVAKTAFGKSGSIIDLPKQ